MSGPIQIVNLIIKAAIALAIAGDLASATKVMINSAAKATQHGSISFVRLNSTLLYGKNSGRSHVQVSH